MSGPVSGPVSGQVSGGRLTTHVLDVAEGRPAAGMTIDLVRDGRLLGRFRTNDDGRLDAPLIEGAAFVCGIYELVFHVERGFYDTIPVRFRVTDPSAHHHVPLLLSPHGYTTYRGS